MATDIHTLYDAFNTRDIDTALGAMHPDVDWPNGWEGGWVHGRDAVREYWTRQWRAIDSRVTPTDVQPTPDGRTAVTVHQVGHDHDGNLLFDATVTHVYATDEDGLITRMDIVEGG
jgi:nuclear transport factor 2 (NTF2) superfamily protein